MRTFVYFSAGARTSGNWDDLMKAGRMDIVCNAIIHSFFISHAIREDVILHLIFYGQPTPPRHITIKSKLYGFELIDLFLLFLYFNVSNFCLSFLPYKFIFVWGSTGLLGFLIHLFKANKPDQFLMFLLRYQFGKNIYSASMPDTEFKKYEFKIKNK